MSGRFRIATGTEAGGEVKICYLHYLELAIFADARNRFLDLVG